MQITGKQIAAARSLAGLTAAELAEGAGLSRDTIMKIEAGNVQPRSGTLADIARVFSERGVEFLENNGVRQKSNSIEVYEGVERFQDFYEFLYEYMRDHGGEVCLSVYDEKLSARYRTNPEVQRQRMRELVKSGKVSYRVLVTEGDFTGDYVEYRQQPAHAAAPTAFYAFGECLALISFQHTTPPYVVVIRAAPLAQAYRQAFQAAWDKVKPVNAEDIKKLKKKQEG